MKRTIRLRESELKKLIENSVRMALNERNEHNKEDYEWEYMNYPDTKETDNEWSWQVKNAHDKADIAFSKPLSMYNDGTVYDLGDKPKSKDIAYQDYYGGDFPENKEASDEYFKDSDYRFTHDGWHLDGDDNLMDREEEFHEPESEFSKDFDKAYAQNESLERKIDRIVSESIKYVNESMGENYTHFAVNKFTNLIVNGWDYSDEDPADLRQFKRDYFINDLKDYGFNPKVYKIITAKNAEKNGINTWSNTGVFPLEQENEMKKQGQNFYGLAHEQHPDWFIE